jgi:divalent metal cation (Fe/Co/Zn/Cd) transporter
MSEAAAAVNEHTYDALTGQLAYRRDRRHNIFAWCSSIYVAAIGGLVAFANKSAGTFNLREQWIVTWTVLILGVFTIWWMYHHWKIEKRIQSQLDTLNKHLRIDPYDPTTHFVDWAQTLAVFGLAITALLATWWSQP